MQKVSPLSHDPLYFYYYDCVWSFIDLPVLLVTCSICLADKHLCRVHYGDCILYICQQTQKLCLTVVTNSDVSKENIAQICANTRKLFRFMACLYVDLPRAARIIKDYPLDYLGHLKRADAAITDLETMQELSERKPKDMMDILPFISQTEEIIITPWLKLMENVVYLESSGI